ncbi:MAG: hypothetical protein ABW252_19930 [Polyangiales bacterium]
MKLPEGRAHVCAGSRFIARLAPWLLLIAAGLAPQLARAQTVRIHHEPEPAAAPSLAISPEPPPALWRTVGLGFAGALTAFLAHETGHVFANLMMGNNPQFEGTMVFGAIPFVVVSPGIDCDPTPCTDRGGERFRAGRRGNYFIVTAGFHVQHLLDEVLLSREPSLKSRYAPFQKGMLLFNLFLSCLYAGGAYTGLEDPHGDLVNAAETSRFREAWLASLLLVPVAMDTYRFFVPSSRWSPWVSRGAKAALLGLNFTF